MNWKTTLLELLLAGFFAVACIRARGPIASGQMIFGNLFRLSDRVERLRRSRWQWFAMVALMLVLRLQSQLPLVLEITALLLLVVFIALPVNANGRRGTAHR
jgi:Na+-transporting methylmalonyl-CoA/oxaloacetate decarboxylase beta subunit